MRAKRAELSEAWKRVGFCVAKDSDPREALKRVNVEAKGERLTFVASDGHRLGRYSIETEPNGQWNTLLKPEFLKNLPEGPMENEVSLPDFDRSTEGLVYPPYKNVYPPEDKSPLATFTPNDCTELRDSFKKLSAFADKPTKLVKLYVKQGEGVWGYAGVPEGSAELSLRGEWEGEALEIGVNGKFLFEILKAIPWRFIKLHFYGPLSAIKIVGGKGLDYLLMPIKLD
jgi:DNA polymerase-3 subunit beta